MKHTSKIKRWLTKLYYSIPFLMKGGNNEIFGNGIGSDNGTEINQNVTDKRVAKHLLKGEVTQEVEELRYRTYRVAEESRDYEYIGNGTAVKKQKKTIDANNYSFSMECKMFCNSVLSALSESYDSKNNKYTLDIAYKNPFVRFKIEKFATRIDVKNINGKITTTIHFSEYPNPYDSISMPFINMLSDLRKNATTSNNVSEYFKRSELSDSILSMSFVTNNATNNFPNMHLFYLSGPSLIGVIKRNGEYYLEYLWEEYKETNLTDKFYSEDMYNKYKYKERKEALDSVLNLKKDVVCPICKRTIKKEYVTNMVEDEDGKMICLPCFAKKNGIII